jgi:DNA-binding GntR family transcriptional regulator
MPAAEQPTLPKFVQIANSVRDRILRGELRPGDEVPSERQIAEEWGVARPTASRAVQLLRSQGLVESRQGSGSFVSERQQLVRRARDRYAQARGSGAIYPEGEWAEIVQARVVKAPAHIAEALNLPVGTKALKRRRITNDPTGPVELSTSWFSEDVATVAPRLLQRERILEGTVAYVEACTGRRAKVATDRVGAKLASDDEATALGLDRPSAVLVVLHVAYDRNQQPLEVVEAVFPPDRWTFQQDYSVVE